jgi:uncharacterized cofD-like protein
LLQHRFRSDGEMDDHAVGNLLIVALWQLLGDHVGALDRVARLLGAEGRVLPMSTVPLDITALVEGADPARPGELSQVRGQVEVATTRGRVCNVTLDPVDPPACPEALQAVKAADWVVLGPGSWFTSVITHLLVPELREALETSRARKLVVLNLSPQQGETEGFAPETHLEVMADHAPALRLDCVLADRAWVDDVDRLEQAAARLGARLELADLALDGTTPRHDPTKLARSFSQVLAGT